MILYPNRVSDKEKESHIGCYLRVAHKSVDIKTVQASFNIYIPALNFYYVSAKEFIKAKSGVGITNSLLSTAKFSSLDAFCIEVDIDTHQIEYYQNEYSVSLFIS